MKKFIFLLIIIILFGCGDTLVDLPYTTENIHVYDTYGKDWGTYLHYFSNKTTGLEQITRDLGYTQVEPSFREGIPVIDTTNTLSPNVTFVMGKNNSVYAGTQYIKNETGSYPIDSGETGDIFFLLHVRWNNKFYSGVYKKEGNKLVGNYYPDWITPYDGGN